MNEEAINVNSGVLAGEKGVWRSPLPPPPEPEKLSKKSEALGFQRPDFIICFSLSIKLMSFLTVFHNMSGIFSYKKIKFFHRINKKL